MHDDAFFGGLKESIHNLDGFYSMVSDKVSVDIVVSRMAGLNFNVF